MTSPAGPAPARSNHWKWFFVIVIALAATATGTLWWFNLSIQLRPEELAQQRQKWQTHRPADYSLTYLRVENDSETGLVYRVQVRGHKVIRAEELAVRVRERRDVDPPEGKGKLLSPEEAQKHSMDALHEQAAAILAEDAASERRVYVRARFHETGALLELVRRLMRSRERTQISVLAFRYGPDLEK